MTQPPQVLTPLPPFPPRAAGGWFGGKCRCGVQAHHAGICAGLHIPIHADPPAETMLVSHHAFYTRERLIELAPPGAARRWVFDLHSVDKADRAFLATYAGRRDVECVFVGHRAGHV